MACQTLVRRKVQLALLAKACGQRIPAYVRLRRRAGVTGQVRFAALEPDEVRMTWTGHRLEDAELPGRPVEVRFELDGGQYVFFASSRGRNAPAAMVQPGPNMLRLSVPLSLEHTSELQSPVKI